MDQGAAPVQFASDGVEGSTEYRALAPLALVALALGLLSPVCLAAPFLFIVPAAAAGTALLALAAIRRAEGRLSGAALARIGLALALASTAAALVRAPVRDRLLQKQLAAVGQEWVDRVAARRWSDSLSLLTAQALYSLGPELRPTDPQPSIDNARAAAIESLQDEQVAASLASAGPWRLRQVGELGGVSYDGGVVRASAVYDLMPADDANDEPFPQQLLLRFLRAGTFETEGAPWRIESWRFVEPSDGR